MDKLKEKMKVLVVDDDETLRMLVGMTIESLNMDMVEASDGIIALEMVKKNKIAFVISDIKMARMDGLEFASKLLKQSPNTEVIIVSGFVNQETMDKAAAVGVKTVISKPYDYGKLEETIRMAAQRARN